MKKVLCYFTKVELILWSVSAVSVGREWRNTKMLHLDNQNKCLYNKKINRIAGSERLPV